MAVVGGSMNNPGVPQPTSHGGAAPSLPGEKLVRFSRLLRTASASLFRHKHLCVIGMGSFFLKTFFTLYCVIDLFDRYSLQYLTFHSGVGTSFISIACVHESDAPRPRKHSWRNVYCHCTILGFANYRIFWQFSLFVCTANMFFLPALAFRRYFNAQRISSPFRSCSRIQYDGRGKIENSWQGLKYHSWNRIWK